MKLKFILCSLFFIFHSSFFILNAQPYKDASLSSAERAADLCSRLTLEEKARLMQNNSPAIPRLGIPQFNWWNEALHGVGRNGYATVFPITMGMAASFDDALVHKVYTAVSDEARAKATLATKSGLVKMYQSLSFWTPNINIFRDPRWGRGQETYGEDPYLTSRMGLAVVRGLQGPSDSKYRKLLACAKHFAIHSGPEWNRHQFDVTDISPRDLYETYLPAFKSLVQEGQVAEVMCAYQRWDGDPCCGNNRLLQQILRDEWGFKGLVVSDCGAISDFWKPGYHEVVKTRGEASAKAVISGTDVECGSDYRSLPEAVRAGLISEEQINVSVRRLLQMRFELGDFDPLDQVEWTKISPSVIASKEHKQLALDAARESMVLMQNDGVLPLQKSGQKIVVMGPNAADSTMLWGNYNGTPTSTVSILEGIQQKSAEVTYVAGCGHTRNILLEGRFSCFRQADGSRGLRGCYWNTATPEGNPVADVRYTAPIALVNGGNTAFAQGVNLENFCARYAATYHSDKTETIIIDMNFKDFGCIIFDGDTLVSRWNQHGPRKYTYEVKVEAGKDYPFQVDYAQTTGLALLELDVYHQGDMNVDQMMRQCSDADVVVFVGGISPRLEGEEMKVNAPGFKGGDRTSIELPQVQRDMMARLHQMGKRVVFVNCSGSAMALVPESQNCNAIVQAWYGGESGGTALADVLFGDYNPSGKLPITFYRSTDDLPDFLDYSMKNRTYRYFEGTPLFAFGHGLSYTTFSLGKAKYNKRRGTLTVLVTNTGTRAGSEVVQLYMRCLDDAEGPQKSLRGFTRVQLQPGETKTVTIDVPESTFERFDPSTNTVRLVPGRYELLYGTSSADANLQAVSVKRK